jgi:hypothetical protein
MNHGKRWDDPTHPDAEHIAFWGNRSGKRKAVDRMASILQKFEKRIGILEGAIKKLNRRVREGERRIAFLEDPGSPAQPDAEELPDSYVPGTDPDIPDSTFARPTTAGEIPDPHRFVGAMGGTKCAFCDQPAEHESHRDG